MLSMLRCLIPTNSTGVVRFHLTATESFFPLAGSIDNHASGAIGMGDGGNTALVRPLATECGPDLDETRSTTVPFNV